MPTILYQSNPSWFLETVPVLIVLLILGLAYGVSVFPLPAGLDSFVQPLEYLMIVLAILVLLRTILEHFSIVYTLTDTKVMKKTGILSTNVEEAPYNKIQDSNLDRSFVQRIFGAGDIYVDTAGTPGFEIVLEYVTDPDTPFGIIQNNT